MLAVWSASPRIACAPTSCVTAADAYRPAAVVVHAVLTWVAFTASTLVRPARRRLGESVVRQKSATNEKADVIRGYFRTHAARRPRAMHAAVRHWRLRTFRLCSTRPRSLQHHEQPPHPDQSRAERSLRSSRARRAGEIPPPSTRSRSRWTVPCGTSMAPRCSKARGSARTKSRRRTCVNRGQEQRCFTTCCSAGVPSIGLSIGARLHVSTLGLAGYAMLISGSVMQAFRCMGQFPLFMGLYFDVRIDAHADGMSVTISRYNGEPDLEVFRSTCACRACG